MENLLPAGNREALERAVAAGADAVYLGYSLFSARSGAGNFDAEQMREAIRFAHLYHVRVHVTVNTLIKDSEMEAALQVVGMLADLGADAVLIQDLGLLRMVRLMYPDLPVHASTQMTIHNLTGVRLMRDMGVRRVVLAREMPLSEIEKCCRQGVEIETFVHGAQCVCVSGQCLFSSAIGERSGNRGRCAQPCRLPYQLCGQRGAWLSPRDNCLRDDLDMLMRIGVDSVKTEGRLKRGEYVAVVGRSYRGALESLKAGRFRKADAAEREALCQIFQRGGFMRGYSQGCEDAGIVDPVHVSHIGVELGKVERARAGMAEVLCTKTLSNGDQLQFARTRAEVIYAGPEVPCGGMAKVRLRPGIRVSNGESVRRLTSEVQLQEARAMPLPRLALDASLTAIPGRPLSLTLSDGKTHVTVEGSVTEAASGAPLTHETAYRSLSRMGDTPFSLRSLSITGENAFVPVSVLNQLRREACERIADAIAEAFRLPRGRTFPPDSADVTGSIDTPLYVKRCAETLGTVTDGIPVWDPKDFALDVLERQVSCLNGRVFLMLPRYCEEDTLQALRSFVQRHADRLLGVIAGNVGQIYLDWGITLAAGPGIPVTNRRTVQFLMERGCAFCVASRELSREETLFLAQGLPVAVPCYGQFPVMLLKVCPARVQLGLSQGHADCRMCDRKTPDSLWGKALQDRMNASWPLQRVHLPEGCMVRLLDARCLDIRRETRADHLTGWFGEASDTAPVYAGHWKRPVE